MNKVLLFYSPAYSDFHPDYPNRTMSGFFAWRYLLEKALKHVGLEVHINNYELAKSHPNFPVGIIGHAHILENWKLPNPAVLGPSLFDHPTITPDLMKDSRYRYYLVTCEWFRQLFIPYYGDSCVLWHAGIDLNEWPDTRNESKSASFDLLVYDKVRWNREDQYARLISPIIEYLKDRGLSYTYLRYGNYSHTEYRELLKESRAMIFLCEHETQGMGYQEALASNVPVLAWDAGFWTAPQREQFEVDPVPATSVPYFSEDCGERFVDFDEFRTKFDYFWDHLYSYSPRKYVQKSLSLEKSGQLYMNYYSSCQYT